MKTIIPVILFIVSGVLCSSAFAQSSLNYSIQNSTGGTLLTDANGNIINTAASPNLMTNGFNNQVTGTVQPIGFDFVFMGKYYSHFVVGSNGQFGFGAFQFSFRNGLGKRSK